MPTSHDGKIGIHAIFGAFLFGASCLARSGHALSTESSTHRADDRSPWLLPVFFIITGLNVDIKARRSGLGELGAVLPVACVGKFFGAQVQLGCWATLAQAAAIGVLMNTRGLTELVILTIGLGAGVLDLKLFTVLVLMAISRPS